MMETAGDSQMNASVRPIFKVGEHVSIRQDDPGPYAGLPAVIESCRPNDRGVTVLDRYVVVFKWNEKQVFYAAQLKPCA